MLQVVGTHNSYHQAPPEEIQNLAYNPLVDAVAGSYAQSAVNTTQYSHLNFYEQLELGKHLTWCLHLRARLPQQFIRQPFIICSMSDALSPYVMHAQDYATHCTALLVALAMDFKSAKRLQAPLSIEVLYVHVYFDFCVLQTS